MRRVFHYEETDIPDVEEIQRQVDEEMAREEGRPVLNREKRQTKKEVTMARPTEAKRRTMAHSTRLFEPVQYADGEAIASALIQGQSVYVSLKQLDNQHANRLIDFLTGVVYGIDGDITRVGATMFLCTPPGIVVTEDMKKRFERE